MLPEPVCYFVFQEVRSWLVEFDHQDVKHPFPTFEEARDAARRAAEDLWLLTGHPSCVRIGSPTGRSEMDMQFHEKETVVPLP